MAESETQEEQGFAWDSFFSGVTDVAVAGLGVLAAKEQAEPAPVPKSQAVTAISEATPVVGHVGSDNNGTTVIQPTGSGGLMNNKPLLIGGGIAAMAVVLVLAMRKG